MEGHGMQLEKWSRPASSHADLVVPIVSASLWYQRISLSILRVSLSLARSHCISKWELGLITQTYSVPLP